MHFSVCFVFVHWFTRVLSPSPHVREQSLHAVQSGQTFSKLKFINYMYLYRDRFIFFLSPKIEFGRLRVGASVWIYKFRPIISANSESLKLHF